MEVASKITGVPQYVRGLIDARPFGIASVTEFGALNNGRADCTAAFNAALASPARLVVVPPGFYRITAPLKIPCNTGKWILGLGGAKSVALTVGMAAGNAGRAAIEYTHDASRQPNHAGCVLQNLHVIGNSSVCHGVHLQEVSYPVLQNVIIEGFDGAGLLLDKCQDGSFNNVALVDCGRTTGDPARNADTEYAPLHLVSSIPNDHCNMLRFSDCQLENNRVSPYIWIDDPGPIGIWFDRIHAENADPGAERDLLRSSGGDCHFAGIAAVGFREGFILEGYGNTTFSDCRELISVLGPSNVVGSIRMANVRCGRLSWTSLAGQSSFINSTIGDVIIRWPALGPTVFTACSPWPGPGRARRRRPLRGSILQLYYGRLRLRRRRQRSVAHRLHRERERCRSGPALPSGEQHDQRVGRGQQGRIFLHPQSEDHPRHRSSHRRLLGGGRQSMALGSVTRGEHRLGLCGCRHAGDMEGVRPHLGVTARLPFRETPARETS